MARSSARFVQRLPSAVLRASSESRPGTIGLITLDEKQPGKPSDRDHQSWCIFPSLLFRSSPPEKTMLFILGIPKRILCGQENFPRPLVVYTGLACPNPETLSASQICPQISRYTSALRPRWGFGEPWHGRICPGRGTLSVLDRSVHGWNRSCPFRGIGRNVPPLGLGPSRSPRKR